MREEVIATMDRARERLIAEERRTILVDRLKLITPLVHNLKRQQDDKLFPLPSEFARMPEVRAILEAPNDVTISEQHLLDALNPRLPALLAKWKNAHLERIAACIHKSDPANLPGDPHQLFSLAIGAFLACGVCRLVKEYPDYLHEACCHQLTEEDNPDDNYFATLRVTLRVSSNLAMEMPRTVRSVISAFGQDPNQVTTSIMDALESTISCKWCKRKGIRPIMDWRAAVSSLFP